MSTYTIRYGNRSRGETFIWGSRDSLSEANTIARGLTSAPDIARARVVTTDGKIATEYGRNGELLRYRNDV